MLRHDACAGRHQAEAHRDDRPWEASPSHWQLSARRRGRVACGPNVTSRRQAAASLARAAHQGVRRRSLAAGLSVLRFVASALPSPRTELSLSQKPRPARIHGLQQRVNRMSEALRIRRIAWALLVLTVAGSGTIAIRSQESARSWAYYAGDKAATRYSPLDQITRRTSRT